MSVDIVEEATSLLVSRRFDASIDDLWAAWTDPRTMARWLAPEPTWGCRVPQLELRVGGRYVIEMIAPGGETHRASGRYEVVERPHRLEFTWRWGPADGPSRPSRVRIELEPDGRRCILRLRHDRLNGPEAVAEHAHGWRGCLGQLVALTSRPTEVDT